MALPAELSDVLAGPLEGATRIVVRHERCSAFRPLALLELACAILLFFLVIICLVIVLVFAAVAGGGGGGGSDEEGAGLPFFKIRFFRYWQELVIRVQDAQGEVLNELRHPPRDPGEGNAVLAAILEAADRSGIVVVQTLGGPARETLEVWYGGQPLLAHPELRDRETAAVTLTKAGYEVAEEGKDLLVRRSRRAVGKASAVLHLVIDLLILPFAFWQRAFRRAMHDSFLDLKGVPPEAWVLTLHGERRLSIHTERGGQVRRRYEVDGRDLLGIAWSATLDYDRDVTRRPPRLRVLERRGAVHVEDAPYGSAGEALRDYVVAVACERWEGIPSLTTRPTRCPYCGNLFVLSEATSCPSCGASPGAL